MSWHGIIKENTEILNLVKALGTNVNKAQIASMHVLNGYKIGRIRPTNKVVFQVQKFDDVWEDIAVSEQLAQLGNMRLMSRGKDGYKPNDFTKAIEWVLSTMDIEG